MKEKYIFELGQTVRHYLTKRKLFIIARYEREHICGVNDIQYLVRAKDFNVHEVSETELRK